MVINRSQELVETRKHPLQEGEDGEASLWVAANVTAEIQEKKHSGVFLRKLVLFCLSTLKDFPRTGSKGGFRLRAH